VLKKKKGSKEKELKKIKENKVELTHYIEEKQVGLKELEILRKKILEDKARFERAERIRRQQELLKSKTFAEVEGLLPWPAEGKVVTKFGKHRNLELKTVTESLGIDIKGKLGSPIRSVLGGVITTITYIRGYGTMIIIDHGGDFYTVYSHVSNIQTSIDSEVQAGDVIAYMGDSGSINGATLHFEIWGKNQKLDPEKWLVKK
jgi:murein DD-endopeptidase MepM/ murein hydrolase activator NlpD